MSRLIDFMVDKYGLEYYWWYWPASILITIVAAVLWVKLQRDKQRRWRERQERYPDPPRDSWL